MLYGSDVSSAWSICTHIHGVIIGVIGTVMNAPLVLDCCCAWVRIGRGCVGALFACLAGYGVVKQTFQSHMASGPSEQEV